VRSAVTSPIVAFPLSGPLPLSLVVFLACADHGRFSRSPSFALLALPVRLLRLVAIPLPVLLKIHSCGAAGCSELSVLLINSFGSLTVQKSTPVVLPVSTGLSVRLVVVDCPAAHRGSPVDC
jgi:hypothetical protein